MNKKQVIGFENYEVDTAGNVYSVVRHGETPFGIRSYGGKRLTPFMVKGYRRVTLRRDGHTHSVPIHKIVLETFVGPKPEGCQCRHLDGDRANNSVVNLVWGTSRENADDKIAHGSVLKGEQHKNSKLTAELVEEIRKKREPISTQAVRYGVSVSLIRKIRGREAWKHI